MARDVKQMALALVNLFEIGVVGDTLDALLRWDYLVITRHGTRARDQASIRIPRGSAELRSAAARQWPIRTRGNGLGTLFVWFLTIEGRRHNLAGIR
jgi:hypothetical protein